MPHRILEIARPSGRLALLLGFGTLLFLIAATGVDALQVFHEFRGQEQRIRQHFITRVRLLNDIRSEVYLSGTYVRDFLLEPDPGRAAGFGANLADVRAQMENDLASLGAEAQPVERTAYAALTGELARYWATIEPVLGWDAARRAQSGYAFLRDQVFPRRAATLEIASRIGDLNEQQLQAEDARSAQLLDRFQQRLAVTLPVALLIGLGMAVFTARRILDLEAQTHARLMEVADARAQLTRLSARLVDVQEQERKTLARELHDEVGQLLSAVLIETRTLIANIGKWPAGQLREHVDNIKSSAESAVRAVRNLALLLRPSMLDDLGLVPALTWQARELSRRTDLDVGVTADLQTDPLPEAYKTCIYRIVQEGLNNSSRHAHARSVQVKIEQEPAALLLTIADDGVGFDTGSTKGMGLLGIEERAAQLGGESRVESRAGRGTVLTVRLPFPQPAQDGA